MRRAFQGPPRERVGKAKCVRFPNLPHNCFKHSNSTVTYFIHLVFIKNVVQETILLIVFETDSLNVMFIIVSIKHHIHAYITYKCVWALTQSVTALHMCTAWFSAWSIAIASDIPARPTRWVRPALNLIFVGYLFVSKIRFFFLKWIQLHALCDLFFTKCLCNFHFETSSAGSRSICQYFRSCEVTLIHDLCLSWWIWRNNMTRIWGRIRPGQSWIHQCPKEGVQNTDMMAAPQIHFLPPSWNTEEWLGAAGKSSLANLIPCLFPLWVGLLLFKRKDYCSPSPEAAERKISHSVSDWLTTFPFL